MQWIDLQNFIDPQSKKSTNGEMVGKHFPHCSQLYAMIWFGFQLRYAQ